VTLSRKSGRNLRLPLIKNCHMTESHSIIPMERIERSILLIRGEKVMLDTDLAELYGVEPPFLNSK
jgi:hypothetical protein